MPHNPFLPHDDTTSSNPFLPDPEEEQEEQGSSVGQIMSRFASRLSRFFTPTRPSGTPEERQQSAQALASGPLGTAEDLLQGFGGALSDIPNPFTPTRPAGSPVAGAEQLAETEIPGAEPPPGFEGLGIGSRIASELGLTFAGGAGIGRGLSRLGAPERLASGGGILGDVARFGPVDVAFAQNPETSGAVALAELTGQEDLAETLRGSRVARTLAEVGIGAIPAGLIEVLRRGPRVVRGASGTVDAARAARGEDMDVVGRIGPGGRETAEQAGEPSLTLNLDPERTGRPRQGRPFISEIEEAETGKTFRATLFRGAHPDAPLASSSPAGARFFAERPEKAIGFTEEAKQVARRRIDDWIERRIPDSERLDEEGALDVLRSDLEDRVFTNESPSQSLAMKFEEGSGRTLSQEEVRELVKDFDAQVTNRLPFDTATPGKGRQLFEADVELNNPLVLDGDNLDEALDVLRSHVRDSDQVFEKAVNISHRTLRTETGVLADASVPAEQVVREVGDAADEMMQTMFEGFDLGKDLGTIRSAMVNALGESDLAARMSSEQIADAVDEVVRNLDMETTSLDVFFRPELIARHLRHAGVSGAGGAPGMVSAELLRAARDQGYDGIVSRLGDQFDKRAFSGTEVVAFTPVSVSRLDPTGADDALQSFVRRIRQGERIPPDEIREAGFTTQEVLSAVARTAGGGVLGGAIGGMAAGEEGAIAGAALGAGVGAAGGPARLIQRADELLFGGRQVADEADETIRLTENLTDQDDRYLRNLLESEQIPDPPELSGVEEAVRVNTPKDLDVNELTLRSVRRIENATPRAMTEEFERAKRLLAEGNLDDRQLDINRTISNIMGLDPRSVAEAAPDLSIEQQLSQALIYGTAKQEWERLHNLTGRVGNQLSEAQYEILANHLDRLDRTMDEALTRVLNIESEFGRGLRLAQAKWRAMAKTPDQLLGWETLARRRSGGAFHAEDRVRLNQILKGEEPIEETAKSDIVKSFLARTVTGSVGGAGVGLATEEIGGVEGASGVGALIGAGLGFGGGLLSRGQIIDVLRAMPDDELKSLQLARFMQEMEGRTRGAAEAYVDLVRAGLLSAIKTDIVNIGSTLSHMAARRIANPGSAMVDRILKLTQDVRGVEDAERTVALRLPEMQGGFARFDESGNVVIEEGRLRNAIEDARRVWRGSSDAQDVLRRMDFSGWRTGNAFIDGVFDYGFRRLGAEDRAMKGLAFYTALRERARAIALTELANDPKAFKALEDVPESLRTDLTRGATQLEEGVSVGTVQERVKELLANPPDDMTAKAWLDAEKATFTNQTTLGTAVTSFKENMRQSGLVGAMAAEFGVPFVNTLVNVADSFLKFTPGLGLARTDFTRGMNQFVDMLVRANKMDPGVQRAFAEAIGAQAVGLAPLAAGALLYKMGLMTGAWPKDSDANIMAQGNFQPYAVKIGNNTVSLENVSPVGNVMAMGAHTASVFENPDIPPDMVSKLTASAAGSMEQLGELSFLTTATTMLEGITDPTQAGKALDNLGRMHVPTILRQAAASRIPVVGDPTFRGEGGPGELGDVPGVGALLKSLPGVSRQFEPQIDRLGNVRVREPSNFFEAAGNPFRVERLEDSPVIRELTRLGVGIPDLSTPERRGVGERGGAKLEQVQQRLIEAGLSEEDAQTFASEMAAPEQLTRLRRIYGFTLASQLESIMRSPMYQGLPDEQRRELLDKTISSTRSKTTTALEEAGELPPSLDPTEQVQPIFQRVGSENNPFLPGGTGGGTEENVGTTGGTDNPFLP